MTTNEPTRIESQFYFSIIPEWITDHPELSDGAVRCYSVLARYANGNHEVWPGQAVIAERMRKSERVVRRYFAELMKVGALELVKKRFDSSSIYLLVQLPPVETDRTKMTGRSLERFSDRTKTSKPIGQNLPPNERIELDKYLISTKTYNASPSYPQPAGILKDQKLKSGYGCEQCETTGFVKVANGVKRCSDCHGSGIIQRIGVST